MPDKKFHISHKSDNDNEFKISSIGYDKDFNTVDIHLNKLYISLHPDYAREMAVGILKALKEVKNAS